MKNGVVSQLLLVGFGGFVGSVLRYAVSGLAHRLAPFAAFPYGTLTVNLVGCLVLGLLAGLADSRQLLGADARLFLFLGCLGGFTTFSTFGYETFMLVRDAEPFKAAASVTLHVVGGLLAVWVGYAASRMV